jgi:hypothetical protein
MASVPQIRIFPMSSKLRGFEDRDIDDVQRRLFMRDLVKSNGRWPYQSTGLNALAGSLVLFQFRARIIASAIFLRDERFDHSRRGHAGFLHFDSKTIQTFRPLDVAAMRKVWPTFRALGHVKQYLNPTLLTKLKRQLKPVGASRRAPSRSSRATRN